MRVYVIANIFLQRRRKSVGNSALNQHRGTIMAGLKLSHIYKVYPNGVKAVNDFSMDIEDKEFSVFVGPSGCGKSTTLRMIAGLEEISAGELRIGDEIVNDVEPKERDIAMVFQNYALYPNMSVYGNMAFGLKLRRSHELKFREKIKAAFVPKIRKMNKLAIDEKVKEAAEILGITQYLERKPKALSGGQRQRVALGRAIVREPKVFLFDEPLSNLDAKLRGEMRAEILKLHKKLSTTFIYVTHDQIEAMTMGTRIVVMRAGRIQQIDTPRNLYRYPYNKFVAGFIGTPQMNFFECTLKRVGNEVELRFSGVDKTMTLPYSMFAKCDFTYLNGEKPVILGVRGENISFDENKYPNKLTCRLYGKENLGTDYQVIADLDTEREETMEQSPTGLTICTSIPEIETGRVCTVSLDSTKFHFFDKETEINICLRVPTESVLPCEVKDGKIIVAKQEIVLPPAMLVEDGEYIMRVPVDAISVADSIKVKFEKEEDIDGKSLVAFELGDNKIFALNIENPSQCAEIAIDLKRVKLEGAEEKLPLNTENTLTVQLSKEKEQLVDENGKKQSVIKYYASIGQQKKEVEEEFIKKLQGSTEDNIFKKPYNFKFGAWAEIKEEGFVCEVGQILDYGTERYAKCTIEGQEVLLAVDEDFQGEQIAFALNTDDVVVYDCKTDVRIA